jgi:hypothetical protein
MRHLALVGMVFAIAVSAWAQAPAYGRGEVVRVRPTSSPSETRTTLPLKVVAVPGDRITVRDSAVLVNSTGLTGFSPDLVARMARSSRTPQTVPANHYVVAGERRVNQDISEYWGLHPGSELEVIR